MVYVNPDITQQQLAEPAAVRDWLMARGFQDNQEQIELIQRAFDLARRAHEKQQRASGEPYINHLLAVADILLDLQLDGEAIAAAILHDVIEDTETELATLEKDFGHGVAQLVDGVTKMALIDAQASRIPANKERLHAESLRKMLLAMAEDVRVVLIKLADRLHNMRTLKHLPEYKQRRIAKETMDIYAPLANRLGIWQIKWELEDLSFRYMYPERYKQIAKFLDERRIDRETFIQRVITILQRELEHVGIKADVTGRPKHIYSIWKKMQRKGLDFNQLYDVRAVRVLVEHVHDCYAALGVVHTLWRHIPREFDDYIATPKENNYQSIHTAVIGPEGKTLEVQIRTSDMHQHAELGVAAHWRYKEGKGTRSDTSYEQKIAWLRQLLEWKEEADNAGDFIDRFKSEVFQDRAYVLTPQGDVMDLPQGATPLDFAYYIHTEIGNRCRGARVDGRIVPLTYELKSGEQVEVLTTKQGHPSRDWLNPQLGYLKTSRARAKARQWFKSQDHDENVSSGRSVLEKELHRLGLTNVGHKQIAEKLGMKHSEDMYAALGRGDLTPLQAAGAAQELLQPEPQEQVLVLPKVRKRKEEPGEVKVQGVGNLLTKMARCCSPAPGDPIVGFITLGRGVTIHRRDCRNVLKMDDQKRKRLIDVEWSSGTQQTYPVVITVEAIDRHGLLGDIITVLTNEEVNVTAVNTLSNKKDNTAKMHITLEVHGVEQLSRVLNRIGQINNIMEVRRTSQA
jgi:GTP pyrophosphokinase